MKPVAPQVLIVCPPPVHTIGGIQSYTQSLAGELRESGCSVTVVTSSYEKSAEPETALPIIRIRSLPAMSGRFPIPRLGGVFQGVRLALARKSRPIVIIQARFYLLSLIFATAARFATHRVLVIDHGSAHLSVDQPAWDAAISAFEHVATAWLRLIGVRFGAVSARSAHWLEHFGVQGARIVPNGIAAATIDTARCNNAHEFSIAYCGRLLPQKGILQLIAAVRQLHDEQYRCWLTVAGEGPLESDVRIALSDVPWGRFVGSLQRDQVLELLGATSAVVLPSSRPEGAPSIILEAAARGAVVVTSIAGDGAGLVEHERTGLLLEDGSTEQITHALRRLQDEPQLARTLAENLMQTVRSSFTWTTIAAQLLRDSERAPSRELVG